MFKNSLLVSYVAIISSACLYGLLVFGAKVMGINGFSLMQVLIIPNTIVVCVLFWFVRSDIKNFFHFPLWIMLLYVLNQILGQVGQFAPVFMGLSVSLAVFLNYTQPLWTILIGIICFHTRIRLRKIIVIIVMFLGLFLLLNPLRGTLPVNVLWGSIVALMGGFCMSVWVVLNSYFVRHRIRPFTLVFVANLYQSLPFILLYPLVIIFLPSPDITGFNMSQSAEFWILVFLYSVFVFIGAQFLFYFSAQKVPKVHLGFLLLLEPVVAVLLDASFLGTALTWNILLGGGLIILANMLLIIKNKEENDF